MEYLAGNLEEVDYKEIEDCIVRSSGHCMVMGTASTMNSIAEALGIAPGIVVGRLQHDKIISYIKNTLDKKTTIKIY